MWKLATQVRPEEEMDEEDALKHLGHRNIQHTVRYTELSPTRFKNFWR